MPEEEAARLYEKSIMSSNVWEESRLKHHDLTVTFKIALWCSIPMFQHKDSILL